MKRYLGITADLAGLAVLCYGVWLLNHPAAWIVAGVSIIVESFVVDL